VSDFISSELPEGWSVARIDKACDVNPRVNKSEIADDLLISFVPMPAVGAGDGSIDISRERPASEVKKGFTAFKEGDVLFAKITPCMENGKMAVVPSVANGYGFGSTEFHVLRPKEGVDARYVYYYVSSQNFRGVAERYMTGAVGQKRVSTTYLKEQKIPLAPPEQQKRIVEEIEKQFSRLDEAVANLKRVKANLKRYKAAVLKAAAEGKLTEEWRKKNPDVEPADKLLERILAERREKWQGRGKYKEPAAPDTTDLPKLPEGWVWGSFEQLTLELTNGFGKRSQAQGESHIVLRLADISNGAISLNDVRWINCTKDDVRKYRLAENDLLILRVNGSPDLVGRFVLIDQQLEDILFCDHFIRVRCSHPVLAGWLRIYSDVERFRKFIDLNKVSSAGQNTISQGTLSPFAIPVPPVEEKHQIANEVERLLSVIAGADSQVNANLRRSDRLRQSILKKAFSGSLI